MVKKKYFFTLHEVLLTPKEPQLQNKRTNPRLLISENNDRFTADGEIKQKTTICWHKTRFVFIICGQALSYYS